MGFEDRCFTETLVNLQTRPIPKQHDLQGPIDDAFMDSFIFVTPTGHSPIRRSKIGSKANRSERSANGAASSAAKRG